MTARRTQADGRLGARSPLVLGLGVSGRAAAEALLEAGAPRLRLADSRDTEEVHRVAAFFATRGAETRVGPAASDPPAVLAGVDLVVASPGVPPSHPVLAAAVAAGTPVWSEPELAWQLGGGRSRLVAVTGTNGKTTTTELLAACLEAPTAGNIGTPLVEVLTAHEPPPLVVAELSSFQLWFTARLRTDVGVLLNVAPDHLDWHGDLASYRDAKARVWAHQRAEDTAVVNVDDPGAQATVVAHRPPGRLVGVTRGEPGPGQVGVADGVVVVRTDDEVAPVLPAAELGLRGPHNLVNALAAVAAATAAGAAPGALGETLRAYAPGPHRLETVATVDGVTYVNDSKATNPHAARAALQSFPAREGCGSVVWIAGGLNKGLDFDELAEVLPERVRAAVTIGTSGPAIAELTRRAGVTTVEAGDLGTAVPAAADLAERGDTVLLAPACASMDQFPDYAARGRAFRDAVAALPGTGRGGGR